MKHTVRLALLYALWVMWTSQTRVFTFFDSILLPIGLECAGDWITLLAFLALSLSLAFDLRGRRFRTIGLTYLTWQLSVVLIQIADYELGPLSWLDWRFGFRDFFYSFPLPLVPLAVASICVRRGGSDQTDATATSGPVPRAVSDASDM